MNSEIYVNISIEDASKAGCEPGLQLVEYDHEDVPVADRQLIQREMMPSTRAGEILSILLKDTGRRPYLRSRFDCREEGYVRAPTLEALLFEVRTREKIQNAWIEKNGSTRLKRCVVEAIEHQAIYRDERLGLELPGWLWEDTLKKTFVLGEPRNPSTDAFVLLDRARELASDAKLKYGTMYRKVDEKDGEIGDKEGEVITWRGCVAITIPSWADRQVVFFPAAGLVALS